MGASFGTRTQRIYALLRERIARGEIPPGARLAPHRQLADELGVAPMTIRQVLARLEEEGLISREQGRGTFVRSPASPRILVVDDDPVVRALLERHIEDVGCRAILTASPSEAMAALEADDRIAAIFSDVRMPTAAIGTDFIRTVRRRWRSVPLAAVTGYPADLAELMASPEAPVLVIPKPFRAEQVEEALGLALGRSRRPVGRAEPNGAGGARL